MNNIDGLVEHVLKYDYYYATVPHRLSESKDVLSEVNKLRQEILAYHTANLCERDSIGSKTIYLNQCIEDLKTLIAEFDGFRMEWFEDVVDEFKCLLDNVYGDLHNMTLKLLVPNEINNNRNCLRPKLRQSC